MIRWAVFLLKCVLRIPLWSFQRRLKNPKETQRSLLNRLHKDYVFTQRARSFPWKTVDAFSTVLPIVDYDDIESDIHRQKETKEPVCTSQPVLFYEKTAGSRGPNKLIPYTSRLKHSFSRMFTLWVGDLLWEAAPLKTGQIYMSITEPQSESVDGLSENDVGLEDDRDYLSKGWATLLSPFWITAPRASPSDDLHRSMLQLAVTLIDAGRLEIISIWSPSFLLAQLTFMQDHWSEILDSPSTHRSPWARRHISKRRETLRAQFSSGDKLTFEHIWPHLKIISCWDSAHSSEGADAIRALFPNVLVQGKGLLATEAPMTIPFQRLYANGLGMVPLIDEVYFEFEEEDGAIRLIHELEEDKRYGVIISQQSGLLRYRMGDDVRVNGWAEKTPLLEFLGKGQAWSDLVGEKLSETFVEETLEELGFSAGYRALVPQQGQLPYYLLLVDECASDLTRVVTDLDAAFRRSHHYDVARRLSQLGPPQVFAHPRAYDILVATWVKSGRKWGDMKPSILYPSLLTENILEDYHDALP